MSEHRPLWTPDTERPTANRVQRLMDLGEYVAELEAYVELLEQSVEQYYHESRTDYLTGALNRKGTDEKIEEFKKKGIPYGLLTLDVDNFHEFNERLGHHAGDLLLQYKVDFLEANLRESDAVGSDIGRPGGDEFNILLDLSPANNNDRRTYTGEPRDRLWATGSRLRSIFMQLDGVRDYNEFYKDDCPTGFKMYGAVGTPYMTIASLRHAADPKNPANADRSTWPPIRPVELSEFNPLESQAGFELTEIVKQHIAEKITQ